MGTYLSTPKTEKESSEGEDEQFRYGVSAMQGWRSSMEDAHATVLNILDTDGKNSSIGFFGVFDGHGGKEVALFAAKHLVSVLVDTKGWKAGNLETGISEAFLQLDASLTREELREELLQLAQKKKDDPMDDDDVREAIARTGYWKEVDATNGIYDAEWSGDEYEDAVYDPLTEIDRSDPAIGDEDVMTRADSEGEEELMAESSGQPKEADSDSTDSQEESLHPEKGSSRSTSYSGPSAGCTAVVALVAKDKLIVANAGDSRCVASRNGTAHAMTHDHKPTDDIESARIFKAGGFIAEGRVNGSLNLSRALGDMEFKRSSDLTAAQQMITADPEVRTLSLQLGDEFLILACDGIWDVLSNQQAVDFARKGLQQGKSPKAVCEAMCDRCLAPNVDGCGEGCDNMSAMIVVLKSFAQDDNLKGVVPVPPTLIT